jgi:hypothetical protein
MLAHGPEVSPNPGTIKPAANRCRLAVSPINIIDTTWDEDAA